MIESSKTQIIDLTIVRSYVELTSKNIKFNLNIFVFVCLFKGWKRKWRQSLFATTSDRSFPKVSAQVKVQPWSCGWPACTSTSQNTKLPSNSLSYRIDNSLGLLCWVTSLLQTICFDCFTFSLQDMKLIMKARMILEMKTWSKEFEFIFCIKVGLEFKFQQMWESDCSKLWKWNKNRTK
jgi:hypothetical protein